jgi:hypothetical protein
LFCKYESAPLEDLLLGMARDSLHVSVELLWMLENYMHDTKNIARNALYYLRAARMLAEIQRAVFRGELRGDFSSTLRAISKASATLLKHFGEAPSFPAFSRTAAPLVGLGCMVSSFLCPEMARALRPLVAMQALRHEPLAELREKSRRTSVAVSGMMSKSNESVPQQQLSGASTPSGGQSGRSSRLFSLDRLGPSLEDLSRGKAFSFKRYMSRTARILLPSSNTSLSSSVGMSRANGHFQEEVHVAIESRRVDRPTPTSLFTPIPLYYHSDMQFIAGLVNISERLQSYDRSLRMKALHAELCLINHNLPAALCLHAWCSGRHGHGHHRILSVSPYEAVVLNSSERVPYILFIEVLKDATDIEFAALLESRTVRSVASESGARKRPQTPQFDAGPSDVSVGSEADSDLKKKQDRMAELSASFYDERIATTLGIIDVAERMRTAAVMLAQLSRQGQTPGADLVAINNIRARIMQEMEALEKDRLVDALENRNSVLSQSRSMDMVAGGKAPLASSHIEHEKEPEPDSQMPSRHLPSCHDPSTAVFLESWDDRLARLARTSEFSHLPGWGVMSVIVKGSTDMRQEHLAYQLVSEFSAIFDEAELPIFLYPYRVLVASNGGGLIETVPNTTSIHSMKKSMLHSLGFEQVSRDAISLKGHFIRVFGGEDSSEFHAALGKFVSSLTGYSLVTYLLQVRDRHNGNILLDREGHLIHIDFGFMLSNSPGYVGFETAPFKLTAEYIDLLGGVGSASWQAFRDLFTQGFLAIRKHSDRLVALLEILMKDSALPCFYAGEAALLQFKERLHLSMTDQQVDILIDRLLTNSALNIFSRLYDNYQYYTNGIL